MRQVTFLGTGTGMPTRSCCTSLLLEEGNNHLLIDLAGGHELLGQFHKLNRSLSTIRNVFISHYDSDHIAGVYPLIRSLKMAEEREPVNIFCSHQVKEAIDSMFKITGHQHYGIVQPRLNFILLKDGDTREIGPWKLTFFDLHSNRSPQMGFKVQLTDGKTLVFLGDEPAKPPYEHYMQDADMIVHNAFCLEKDEGNVQARKKNHSTVKDAAEAAQRFNVKTLILFHMEDRTLETRKEEYVAEARRYFNGMVFVPVDMDVFRF